MPASSDPPSHTPSAHPPSTRLAPSPTGALHLGNARTFLVNWALARCNGWSIVLRIEDLDTPRNKPGADTDAIETLRWLGLDWDAGPFYQLADLDPYASAMQRLAQAGLVYPCDLTRSEIEAAASAPQAGPASHETRFPPSLRPPLAPLHFNRRDTNWRFAVPDRIVSFTDDFAGPQSHNPAATIGDFVVWTARAQPAYQLAVVVDDSRQGVTHVVRGDDLLDSAARQILLYESLALGPHPAYTHLPLVVGSDGRRLAKRHGDTRIARYRALGAPPERLIGWLAWSCGLRDSAEAAPRSMPLAEFAARFDLSTMPRSQVVFRPEDESWLTA